MNFLRGFIGMASSYAQPLMRSIKRRWLRALIWALAACLVLFFYGDAFRLGHWEPFDTQRSRIIACLAILAGWAVYVIGAEIQDRRANKSMINAITTDQQPNKSDLSAQELDQIRGRLQEALVQLRRVGGGRRGYVYQLPWYVMIGPPGSGKTTALLNSGLKFPLAESIGKDPLRGVGGTRNCEWWFTEDAILLDTAGRYTTQDSDPEIDKQGWRGFLNLLKTYRPLQPINGVIVAISLEDVVNRDPQERLAAAQAIRLRLTELSSAFESRSPIYVLLTKADLLAGFVPFFDAYNRSDREQVWGMTFPLDDGKPDTQTAVSRFDIEFDQLLTRMNAIVLERLQQETDIQRRGLIYGFPIQVATLKEPLKEMLDEIFSTSRFDRRPLLRGIYLTSGTQSGAPIDRMMYAMASTFGMDAPRQPVFTGQEKSYFLTRLLDQVIFAEASLVAADPRTRRRMAMTRGIAAGVAAAVVLVAMGAWGVAYSQNRALVSRADQQIATYRSEVAAINFKDVSDTDFDRILPPLDQLRDGPGVLRKEASLEWLPVGLDQSKKVASQYSDLYTRALDDLMLPRVLVFLQNQMRRHTGDTEFNLAALRVYLGLGGEGPLDRAFAAKWMSAEWQTLYPGADADAKRADLDRHFAALLAQPIQPVALDAGIIADVRAQIQKVPLAARAYAILRDSPDAAKLTSWTVADKVGAAGERAFIRVSNAPLTAGIPGFYTRDGYYNVLLPGLQNAVAEVGKERWVYGETGAPQASDSAVSADAVALYRQDFNARWTTLLGDLRIKPLTDLGQSVVVLTALSGPDSVLMKLVNAILRDTDLSPPDAKDKDADRIKALIGASPNGQAPEQPFQPLRDAMKGSDGNPSQIAGLMRTLGDLYEQLSRASNSPQGVLAASQTASGLNDANQKLLSESRQVPDPVQTWLSGLTTDVSSVTSGTARSAISQAWAASAERLCGAAVNNRYPFARNATSEISVDDFTHLFGPGGTMDQFFNENLKQNVNTSKHPWVWEATGVQPVGSAFLGAFEHAEAIKQVFFGGSGGASFHYEFTPESLDISANSETLDVGGQTLSYAHGPVRPTTMVWPAPGDGGVRLDLEPSNAPALTYPGPWAPFRLFDHGNIFNRTRDGFTVSLIVGTRTVSFQVKSDAALNPFTLRDLRQFRCPGAL